MGILKEKFINLFFENEDEVIEEKMESPKVIKRREIIAFSVIINFILNILYVSFICYSGYTRNIGIIVCIVSFIWTILSLTSSYKLYGKFSRLLFYLNLLLILFLSKLWFVYF
ncbi:MAG: hypothetical protein IKM55_02465 [Bacilli bacterium]|nr:hypothetical protein [Bacilli bacterium]